MFPRYFWDDATRLASVVATSAHGSTITDADGRTYLDLTSQWATNNLGNVHPEILQAATQALERYGFLIYFMNPHRPMIELAQRLLRDRPSVNLSRVFLELSGTGAVEAAVKHAIVATERPVVLSFLGQYHGLSIATSMIGSLSAEERRHFEPYGGGAVHAPYPWALRRPAGMGTEEYGGWVLDYIQDRILRHLVAPDRIAAALFEPVACEAGIWIPPKSFVRGLQRLCRANGWMFIDDEVEAGMGRTGRLWAIEHFGVAPDLMAIGKGISGGLLPVAAVLGSERAMGDRSVAAGTTFGGHPAACAAASATLDVMRRDRIAERSERLGRTTLRRMEEWRRFGGVGDVRGLGLCLGVELVKDRDSLDPKPKAARAVFFDCVRRGTILLYNYGDHVLRIQPPLTISASELERALDTLEESLQRYAR